MVQASCQDGSRVPPTNWEETPSQNQNSLEGLYTP